MVASRTISAALTIITFHLFGVDGLLQVKHGVAFYQWWLLGAHPPSTIMLVMFHHHGVDGLAIVGHGVIVYGIGLHQ